MTPAAERLLVVDDDANNRDMLSRRLARRGYEVDVAEDAGRALEKISSAHYDLVLLDQMMPGMSGLDLLQLLRATYSPGDLPAIMVTALDQSQTVVDALKTGANDSLSKPAAARIEAQLSRSRSDLEARERVKTSDPLTGLGNRLMLLTRLAALLPAARPFGVILLDLDGFKVINDSFGHAIGDRILKEVASRLAFSAIYLSAQSGAPCPVVRIGGDEFAVLLENTGSAREAEKLASAILEGLRRPFLVDGIEVAISASLGITIAHGDASAEDVLREADLAMYRAKELGKNRWHRFEPQLRERAQTRMSIVQDLRFAIKRGQLFAAYQPKVDLKTRTILGFEALLRWRHPVRGLLAPATFIPLAEETGLIIPIGEWILGQACVQLREWQERFPMLPSLTMSVNLSVKQLSDPDLLECLRRTLRETGIPASSLRLELTESALMSDLDSSREVLTQMQSLGVGLKLDDFGTGYSSFSYLSKLRFNGLKIDQSFVSRIPADAESHAIVDSIIRLAHALDMTVVAEGIEKPEQADELTRLGCDAGQGYYFSRPVEAHRAELLLQGDRRCA